MVIVQVLFYGQKFKIAFGILHTEGVELVSSTPYRIFGLGARCTYLHANHQRLL